MTYEEYLVEFKPIMINMCKKYNGLHIENDDRLQECYLMLFTLMDKLEEIETIKNKRAYFKASLDNHFAKINLEEHKQQLFNTTSFEDYKINTKDENFSDDYIERLRLYKNQKSREWYARNREKAIAKSAKYAKENKEKIKNYRKLYDKVRYIEKQEYFKEYREKNRDEINRKRREYYQKHKDEISEKRRLKRQQEKELRENGNKKH